jgi:hypothetical protein
MPQVRSQRIPLCRVVGVTTPGDERARLAARSAELRTRVNDLLGQFTERTAQLRAAQQAAAALTATLTSPDDMVRVTERKLMTRSAQMVQHAPSSARVPTPSPAAPTPTTTIGSAPSSSGHSTASAAT